MTCNVIQGKVVRVKSWKRQGENWLSITEGNSQLLQMREKDLGDAQETISAMTEIANAYATGEMPKVAMKLKKAELVAAFKATQAPEKPESPEAAPAATQDAPKRPNKRSREATAESRQADRGPDGNMPQAATGTAQARSSAQRPKTVADNLAGGGPESGGMPVMRSIFGQGPPIEDMIESMISGFDQSL